MKSVFYLLVIWGLQQFFELSSCVQASDYYPLQIGNYWVYEHLELDSTYDIARIVDTTRINGRLYYHFVNKNIHKYYDDLTYDTYAHRDSLGQIWSYNPIKQEEKVSSIVFDTEPGLIGVEYDSVNNWHIQHTLEDTAWVQPTPAGIFEHCYYFKSLIVEIYTDFAFWYAPNVGLIRTASEGESSILRGAYVNGILYGDTLITKVQNPTDKKAPKKFVLHRNHPNPFNPTTTISYTLASSPMDKTELIIYDILGREVVTLFKGYQTAGNYSFLWNGKDSKGQQVRSGTFICVLRIADTTKSRKLTFLK